MSSMAEVIANKKNKTRATAVNPWQKEEFMYIAHIMDLKYDIYAVGNTKAELIENTLIAFEKYLEGFHTTIGEFVEQECNESLENYNNSVWVFLREYLGVHTFDITKGYALGWE